MSLCSGLRFVCGSLLAILSICVLNPSQIIINSHDAHKIFFDSWDTATIEHKETVKMLLLNRANKVLGITIISEGVLSGSLMDVRIIYQFAIKGKASGVIIAHNQPSGISTQAKVI